MPIIDKLHIYSHIKKSIFKCKGMKGTRTTTSTKCLIMCKNFYHGGGDGCEIEGFGIGYTYQRLCQVM